MTDRPKPFAAGKLAFSAGAPLTSNPYKPGQTDGTHLKIDLHAAWARGWEGAAMDELLSKTPVPDLSLIAEVETLLPKVSMWCNHETSASLSYYRDACHTEDTKRIKDCERSLRRRLVQARLEAAKGIRDY